MIAYVFCYGVRIDKKELYELAVARGTYDIYAAVYSRGLEYQILGNANYSYDYLVGRCQLLEPPLVLEKVENHLMLPHLEVDEAQVKQALRDLGIQAEPQYLLAYTEV